jgi:hypothetical protein
LLQHCPSALCHGGNAAATAVTAITTTADAARPCLSNFPAVGTSGFTNGTVETKREDNKQQEQNAGDGPAKKKAKTGHGG